MDSQRRAIYGQPAQGHLWPASSGPFMASQYRTAYGQPVQDRLWTASTGPMHQGEIHVLCLIMTIYRSDFFFSL